MWQLQWMLGLLPGWAWHTILAAGVLAIVSATFVKFIPFISTYSLPIKVTGILVTTLALWMEGGLANEAKWQARVAELTEKIRIAESKSVETNTVIETVYVDRIQVVEKTKLITRNAIRNSANKIDQVCKIDPAVITILNDASKKPVTAGDKK